MRLAVRRGGWLGEGCSKAGRFGGGGCARLVDDEAEEEPLLLLLTLLQGEMLCWGSEGVWRSNE